MGGHGRQGELLTACFDVHSRSFLPKHPEHLANDFSLYYSVDSVSNDRVSCIFAEIWHVAVQL